MADPVIRALASAALMPDLRAILLIDASYAQLNRTARLMQQLLESVTGVNVERVDLSPADTDDTLWGIPFFPNPVAQARLIWKGKLTGERGSQAHIIVIPDLAQLSLAAQRGCVMAAGADVVHLERHAQHDHWRPQSCWLAACAEHDIGKVSLHLLDRFALRINCGDTNELTAEERIHALVASSYPPTGRQEGDPDVPESVTHQIRRALGVQPVFSEEASERVLAYVSPAPRSFRRSLALGRLATAEAMLDQEHIVKAVHADRAAARSGLKLPSQPPPVADPPESPEVKQPVPPPAVTSPPESDPLPPPTPSPESGASGQAPVYESDGEADLPGQDLQLGDTNLYPEDHVAPEREAFALRLPVTHKGSYSRAQGPSVGVERARDLRDLALAATLFEAAKFWVVRRQFSGDKAPWLEIRRNDLRQHRRLPAPEFLLVLVIDYTALRRCAWEDALLPHLEWAYTSRAAIALIKVGAKDAENELRADRIFGRSLLAPQIGAALEVEAGRATPLAHGLELALQTLLHAIQHGRSAVIKARLVVLTDGRGNVPLTSSRTGKIAVPVRREGIEDALQVAEGLRTLSHLEIVFLDPKPAHYTELPAALAHAMGVEPIGISLRPDAESFVPAPDKGAVR